MSKVIKHLEAILSASNNGYVTLAYLRASDRQLFNDFKKLMTDKGLAVYTLKNVYTPAGYRAMLELSKVYAIELSNKIAKQKKDSEAKEVAQLKGDYALNAILAKQDKMMMEY